MSRVYRCFTEKRQEFNVEARGVLNDLRENLGMKNLLGLRYLNRYDVEGITEKYIKRQGILYFLNRRLMTAMMKDCRMLLKATGSLPLRPCPASLTKGLIPVPSVFRCLLVRIGLK